ncbi:choice-of-anchor B family protein [Candidatus Palauibacter sp.]|uniref:choice-of-anchor B family protein n=1 Tax=Candidatus Palauibacter sp. TaxID=3101350 RepID=UPI003AF1E864
MAEGEATVTAISGEVSAGSQVTVLQTAAEVNIAPDRVSLPALGDTARLVAMLRDTGGNDVPGAEVAWSTSDPTIATVDATGLVTAIANGETRVTATSGEVDGTIPVCVRSPPAWPSLQVAIASLGDTVRLSATLQGPRSPDRRGWSVRDSTVVTVVTGLVTAIANGETVVTATSGEVDGTIPVSVRQSAASLAVSPDPLTLAAPGDTTRLSATVRDAGGSLIESPGVAWSSSDATIVAVDGTGLVTAAGKGEATVTATSGEAGGTVAVSVRQSARAVRCVDGRADSYPCEGVDLVGQVSPSGLRPGRPADDLNDVWGWTDPLTGTEYALVGRNDGLSIVDLSDPSDPRPVAFLSSSTAPSLWRDVKVYADHAYIVADAARGHGVHILDLTRLRGLDEFTELRRDARYTRVSSVHNIAINEETGFAYLVGSADGGETCGGGLHMVDVSNPTAPRFAGCHAAAGTGFRGTGYTHDVQCVVYRGPDATYAGREICVGSNETHVVVSDVTDKSNPKTLSTGAYPRVGYAHQGWLDEAHRFFYQNDELDEYYNMVPAARTLVWDLADLEDPVLVREHYGPNSATDHNLYVRGNLIYHSNYNFGIRILDISIRDNPVELGFFDTVPETDSSELWGSWSNYPYFESGILVVTSMREGLFVLRLQR